MVYGFPTSPRKTLHLVAANSSVAMFQPSNSSTTAKEVCIVGNVELVLIVSPEVHCIRFSYVEAENQLKYILLWTKRILIRMGVVKEGKFNYRYGNKEVRVLRGNCVDNPSGRGALYHAP